MSDTWYFLINLLICGSTRSGKTWAELKRLVKAAEDGNIALVVIDPHKDSLAGPLLSHLVARGMWRRVLFERLADLFRVLSWEFLTASPAKDPLIRYAENESNIRAFIDVLCRRRQIDSIAATPLIEEWVLDVLWLYVEQDRPTPLTDIQFAFEPRHPKLRQLIDHCRNPEIASKFQAVALGKTRRSQFAAAARLIKSVCSSPAFAVRCASNPSFNLGRHLDNAGIVIVEGGGATLSDDAMRIMMGSVILQVIRYVRARPTPYPPVVLVVDEATNAGLIGASGFETRALAECAKMGLHIHILVQQLNFPTAAITDAVLANTLAHEWFFNANAAVRRQAAIDLGDREYADVIGRFKVGERAVKYKNIVYSEYVTPLDDPWGFEGLAERKAKRALLDIQARPEYRTPEPRTSQFNNDDEDDNGPSEDNNPQVGI